MHHHVTPRRPASPPRHHLHPASAPPLARTRAHARRPRKPKLAKFFRLFILCPASTYITLTVPCHPTASRAPTFLTASDSTPPPPLPPVPPPPPAPTHSIGTPSVCYCPSAPRGPLSASSFTYSLPAPPSYSSAPDRNPISYRAFFSSLLGRLFDAKNGPLIPVRFLRFSAFVPVRLNEPCPVCVSVHGLVL